MMAGNLTTPDACPGHRFPTDKHIAKYAPGTPLACTWCGLVVGHKEDPRKQVGARFMPRWRPPTPDARLR